MARKMTASRVKMESGWRMYWNDEVDLWSLIPYCQYQFERKSTGGECTGKWVRSRVFHVHCLPRTIRRPMHVVVCLLDNFKWFLIFRRIGNLTRQAYFVSVLCELLQAKFDAQSAHPLACKHYELGPSRPFLGRTCTFALFASLIHPVITQNSDDAESAQFLRAKSWIDDR